MKYLLTQLIIALLSVTLLFYFTSLQYYLPVINDEINWYNVGIVLLLIFLIVQSVSGLILFIIQKVLAYGPKEFPSPKRSLQLGFSLASLIIAILILSILGINSIWFIIVGIVVVVLLNIIIF